MPAMPAQPGRLRGQVGPAVQPGGPPLVLGQQARPARDKEQGPALAAEGYRARLQEIPAAESALFAEALDEVLAPLSQPRYVIPRLILPPPAGPAAAAGLAVRRLVTGHVPATVVYHAVPTALSGNKKLALAFERAWNARVGPGSVVYAGSPEGTGILAAQRGDDPFALTTQIRTLWR